MTYRQDGRPTDLLVDPEELLAAQRSSRKKKLFALGAVAVVIAAAATGGAVYVQQKTRAEIQTAWDRAATCLLGADVAKPSAAFRNLQLVTMSTPSDKRATTVDAWPTRCASPVHAFGEAVKNDGGSAELVAAAEKLGKAIALDESVARDVGAHVDRLFETAGAQKLTAHVAPGVPLPPAPATPFTLATLPASAHLGPKLTLGAIYRAPFSDGTIRFVIDDKDLPSGPATCELPDGATRIACRPIPKPAAELSPALRPWGTTSPKAAPYVFAGDRGKAGIFRSDDGARVVDRLEYGAYGASALDDGALGYLVWNEKAAQTDFVRIGRDGARKVSKVVARRESGNPYYSSAIFWQFVAYKSVGTEKEGIRLVLREIDGAGGLRAPLDVGRILETGQIEGGEREEPHLGACRSGDTTVIRAKGWHNTFLTFLVAGKWTAPVEAQGLGGELQCRAGEAIVTRIWGGPVGSVFKGGVAMQRCTASGCEDRDVVLHKALAENRDVMPREAKDIRAVDLDGKMLVVWSAGERGGLRMRLAPPAEIASAADTVLFDDHVKDGGAGAESTMVGFQLWPTQRGALLLLGTSAGVHAFLIDGSGKRTPIGLTTK